ncbi:GDSL esterase/lipase At1g29670-like [Diospyros lotus]|uniref:GDSL esterase/lipase At1g29670-like n=1 Tax=Diospyros lotus TaxID=55363 RepID=UPI00224CF596|nr:GDSL esterase/lipase At1g29670-like [Diospyros lotus]
MARTKPFGILLIMTCFALLDHSPGSCGGIAEKEAAAAAAEIQGMFVFGSSLVDNGNNNFLQGSLAKADYLPYGIDFPLGPSGRFTNGKNVIDLLGDQLRLPSYIPAFANPSTKGRSLVHGVNYASGASGILDDTGSLAGHVMSLNEQIRKFEEVTLPELEGELGGGRRESFARYLFVVGSGGNDYSFNYFLRSSGNNVSLEDFTAGLLTTLSGQLKKLYGLGARKFVLMSLYPLGCTPMVLVRRPAEKGCMQNLNMAAHLFNTQLKKLIDELNPQLPASNFVYVNAYKMVRDIIRDPSSEGFMNARSPCCQVSSIAEGGNGVLCKRGGSACGNRSAHVFFDGLHPTEAANAVIARNAYASNRKTVVYPMNVEQLARI